MGLVSTVCEEGNLLIITGHMGAGKTYSAVILIQKAVLLGYHVYTNINFFKSYNWEKAKDRGLLKATVEYKELPSNLHVVNKMSQLLKSLSNTSPNIVVLDEAMIYAGVDRHGSKILRWFKGFVVQTRKFNTSTVLISQVKSQLTGLLREQLEHYELFCYKKQGGHILQWYFYYPPAHDGEWTPPEKGPIASQNLIAYYAYDTKSPASLIMDVDMENWLGDISEYDSIELKDHLEEITDKWLVDSIDHTKRSKRDDIVALYLSGESTIDIVKKTGTTTRYVNSLIRDLDLKKKRTQICAL